MIRKILFKTLPIVSAGLALFASIPTQASPSTFSPAVIEGTIRELYDLSAAQQTRIENGQPPELTSEDLAVICDELGLQIAATSPATFNDITVHLLADWRQHLGHRQVTEAILTATKKYAAQDLAEQRSHPRPLDPALSNGQRAGVVALEALDLSWKVFMVSYTFEFGRGLWRTRGASLSSLESFKVILRETSEASLRRRGLVASTTAIATVVRLAQLQLESRKVDPIEELRKAKSRRVHDLAVRVVAIRDLLRSGRAQPPQIQDLGNEVERIMGEVRSLLQGAPEFARPLEPVAEDLSSCARELERRGYTPEASDEGNHLP